VRQNNFVVLFCLPDKALNPRLFLAAVQDYLVVFAAGNDGDGSGLYDVPMGIGMGATSKNALVVGASQVRKMTACDLSEGDFRDYPFVVGVLATDVKLRLFSTTPSSSETMLILMLCISTE
jgi:hypothetical protein